MEPVERIRIPHNQDTNDPGFLDRFQGCFSYKTHHIIVRVMSAMEASLLYIRYRQNVARIHTIRLRNWSYSILSILRGVAPRFTVSVDLLSC